MSGIAWTATAEKLPKDGDLCVFCGHNERGWKFTDFGIWHEKEGRYELFNHEPEFGDATVDYWFSVPEFPEEREK